MKHLDWYMTMKKTSDKRNAKYYAAWLSWGSEYHPWKLIHGCETLHRFFFCSSDNDIEKHPGVDFYVQSQFSHSMYIGDTSFLYPIDFNAYTIITVYTYNIMQGVGLSQHYWPPELPWLILVGNHWMYGPLILVEIPMPMSISNWAQWKTYLVVSVKDVIVVNFIACWWESLLTNEYSRMGEMCFRAMTLPMTKVWARPGVNGEGWIQLIFQEERIGRVNLDEFGKGG